MNMNVSSTFSVEIPEARRALKSVHFEGVDT